MEYWSSAAPPSLFWYSFSAHDVHISLNATQSWQILTLPEWLPEEHRLSGKSTDHARSFESVLAYRQRPSILKELPRFDR